MLPKQPNRSLIDGIRCLQCVATSDGPIGLLDLANELGMEPTRAHRLLRSLAHMGLTQQSSNRKYTAGPAVYTLTAQTLHASHFIRDALGPLESLKREVPYIVAMGVLWNRTVSYMYHAKRRTPLERAIGSFGVWDATDSGIGMMVLAGKTNEDLKKRFKDHSIPNYTDVDALIADLEVVRSDGYAFIETHSEERHFTLAIPVTGNPFAAVGISGQIDRKDIPNLLPLLENTVAAISGPASSEADATRELAFGRLGAAV